MVLRHEKEKASNVTHSLDVQINPDQVLFDHGQPGFVWGGLTEAL